MNENDASMAVKVQLRAEDLQDLWFGSRVKYLLWLTVPFGLYLAYFVVCEILYEGFTFAGTLNIAAYGPIAVVGLTAPFLVPWLRARQMINRGPTLAEPREYFFSASGVRFDGELMKCDLSWNAFYRIAERPHSFLLYLSPMFGAVIPKKSLVSADGISRFRSILRANVKCKLKLR
jgi:YcxB-like protein